MRRCDRNCLWLNAKSTVGSLDMRSNARELLNGEYAHASRCLFSCLNFQRLLIRLTVLAYPHGMTYAPLATRH